MKLSMITSTMVISEKKKDTVMVRGRTIIGFDIMIEEELETAVASVARL